MVDSQPGYENSSRPDGVRDNRLNRDHFVSTMLAEGVSATVPLPRTTSAITPVATRFIQVQTFLKVVNDWSIASRSIEASFEKTTSLAP